MVKRGEGRPPSWASRSSALPWEGRAWEGRAPVSPIYAHCAWGKGHRAERRTVPVLRSSLRRVDVSPVCWAAKILSTLILFLFPIRNVFREARKTAPGASPLRSRLLRPSSAVALLRRMERTGGALPLSILSTFDFRLSTAFVGVVELRPPVGGASSREPHLRALRKEQRAWGSVGQASRLSIQPRAWRMAYRVEKPSRDESRVSRARCFTRGA
jgi:hypothetical protein